MNRGRETEPLATVVYLTPYCTVQRVWRSYRLQYSFSLLQTLTSHHNPWVSQVGITQYRIPDVPQAPPTELDGLQSLQGTNEQLVRDNVQLTTPLLLLLLLLLLLPRENWGAIIPVAEDIRHGVLESGVAELSWRAGGRRTMVHAHGSTTQVLRTSLKIWFGSDRT